MVVVREFRGWKELIPVILLVVSEESDELLHFLVDLLGLAIGLWVVGHGCRQFDAESSVVNSAMNWGPQSEIYFSSMPCTNHIKPGGALSEAHVLTEGINCDHDGIIAVGLW